MHPDEGVSGMRHPLMPIFFYGAASALALISAIVTDSTAHRVLELVASVALFAVCALRLRSLRK